MLGAPFAFPPAKLTPFRSPPSVIPRKKLPPFHLPSLPTELLHTLLDYLADRPRNLPDVYSFDQKCAFCVLSSPAYDDSKGIPSYVCPSCDVCPLARLVAAFCDTPKVLACVRTVVGESACLSRECDPVEGRWYDRVLKQISVSNSVFTSTTIDALYELTDTSSHPRLSSITLATCFVPKPLVQLLPRTLTELSLVDSRFPPASRDSMLDAVLARCPNLTSLSVQGAQVSAPSLVRAVGKMSGSIKTLGLSFGCWKDSAGRCLVGQHTGLNADDILHLSTHISSLRHLTVVLVDKCDHLHIPSTVALWQALFPPHSPGVLESLTIDGFTSRRLDGVLFSLFTTLRDQHTSNNTSSAHSLKSLTLRGLLSPSSTSYLPSVTSAFPSLTNLTLQCPDLFTSEGAPIAASCLSRLYFLRELDLSPQWRSFERDCPAWSDSDLASVLQFNQPVGPPPLLKLRLASIRGGHCVGPATLSALHGAGLAKRLSYLSMHAICLAAPRGPSTLHTQCRHCGGSEDVHGLKTFMASVGVALWAALFMPLSNQPAQTPHGPSRSARAHTPTSPKLDLATITSAVRSAVAVEVLGVGFCTMVRGRLEEGFGLGDVGEGEGERTRAGDFVKADLDVGSATLVYLWTVVSLAGQMICAAVVFLLTLASPGRCALIHDGEPTMPVVTSLPRLKSVFVERHPKDVKWVLRGAALERARKLGSVMWGAGSGVGEDFGRK
ncbi:hypothetical protein M427DRAFT_34149 [Gonapodya prolifera JEL478]|uniref:Uncharacterized protein n=1 Tax=Gonapodya prolifera (strain JEL478) TaxID=1344416 RepID=A0A139A8Y8_GONPJ|nr:hypothetical protein M427DRAFT_34149 [Gonapodya prolifera JEL478]|eukprot:KXS13291.1 hypothetical protein M427DRAFT_34149 [Gonapodya prolifera JEL478]